MLKGTSYVSRIDEIRVQRRANYDIICGVWKGLGEILSFKQYSYWISFVDSRIFSYDVIQKKSENGESTKSVNKSKKKEMMGMVPFADLINHNNEDWDITWFLNEKLGHFQFQASRDIPANKEILTSYGNKGNSFMLINYGFTEEKNEHDFINLWMYPEDWQHLPLFEEKRKLLADADIMFWYVSFNIEKD